MKTCKLEIVVHSARDLFDVKTFGTMDPYVTLCITSSDGGMTSVQHYKTNVAKKGGCYPVWDSTIKFEVSSMNSSYILYCQINHDGKLVDRKIGEAKVPFEDLLAGDALGTKLGYPVKTESGEMKGEIILSHKFTNPGVLSSKVSGASGPKKTTSVSDASGPKKTTSVSDASGPKKTTNVSVASGPNNTAKVAVASGPKNTTKVSGTSGLKKTTNASSKNVKGKPVKKVIKKIAKDVSVEITSGDESQDDVDVDVDVDVDLDIDVDVDVDVDVDLEAEAYEDVEYEDEDDEEDEDEEEDEEEDEDEE